MRIASTTSQFRSDAANGKSSNSRRSPQRGSHWQDLSPARVLLQNLVSNSLKPPQRALDIIEFVQAKQS